MSHHRFRHLICDVYLGGHGAYPDEGSPALELQAIAGSASLKDTFHFAWETTKWCDNTKCLYVIFLSVPIFTPFVPWRMRHRRRNPSSNFVYLSRQNAPATTSHAVHTPVCLDPKTLRALGYHSGKLLDIGNILSKFAEATVRTEQSCSLRKCHGTMMERTHVKGKPGSVIILDGQHFRDCNIILGALAERIFISYGKIDLPYRLVCVMYGPSGHFKNQLRIGDTWFW
jgi:hypothetical protein